MRNGWFRDSYRHSLAARGIRTSYGPMKYKDFQIGVIPKIQSKTWKRWARINDPNTYNKYKEDKKKVGVVGVQGKKPKLKAGRIEGRPIGWGSRAWQEWAKVNAPEKYAKFLEIKAKKNAKAKISSKKYQDEQKKLKEEMGDEAYEKMMEEKRAKKLGEAFTILVKKPKAQGFRKAEDSGDDDDKDVHEDEGYEDDATVGESEGPILITHNLKSSEETKRLAREAKAEAEREKAEGFEEEKFDMAMKKLPGKHNFENIKVQLGEAVEDGNKRKVGELREEMRNMREKRRF